MIRIVHGEDTLSSRKLFTDLKANRKNTAFFEAQNLKIEELLHSLTSGSLFGEIKEIFIENLFSKKKGSELVEIIELLDKYSKSNGIYLWEGKEIGKKTLSGLGKYEDKNFKYPQVIFQFLDNLRPNSSSNLSKLSETLKTVETEIVFYMLTRHFRLLYTISSLGTKNIDEVKRLAPWQRSKLQKQAKSFGEGKLKIIYNKIFEIDKGTKTGQSSLPLRTAIDILMLEI
ncbi:MAG: hypothetical protein HYT09_01055 [Candidatus Levybacteria bacterium]|nr:hypothetical protein [Candidatus Levybacteria bacterium]